ncbi:MAG: hypothetical protein LC620_02905 [Halobacteriales archaeon]|nr:hypothetical protein [Halobacteriales archaeon]
MKLPHISRIFVLKIDKLIYFEYFNKKEHFSLEFSQPQKIYKHCQNAGTAFQWKEAASMYEKPSMESLSFTSAQCGCNQWKYYGPTPIAFKNDGTGQGVRVDSVTQVTIGRDGTVGIKAHGVSTEISPSNQAVPPCVQDVSDCQHLIGLPCIGLC